MQRKKVEVNTPKGVGVIEEIWISELGFLMVKVYFSNEQVWVSYNLGIHDVNENILTKAITESSLFINNDKRP